MNRGRPEGVTGVHDGQGQTKEAGRTWGRGQACLTVCDRQASLLGTLPSGGLLVSSGVFTGACGNEALLILNKKSYLSKI